MVLLQLEEQPPIVQTIFGGTVEEMKELINYKQDVNCLDCERRTPLHASSYKGDFEMTSILLENGARVNAKDSKWITPLHRAVANDCDETVSLLLSYHADVSARDKLWQTPLHIAAANDAYNSVNLLLNYVPNPNVTDRSGRTALHHACFNGHLDVAELLINKGCIVNACDKRDCRPLHCAVQNGHIATVKLLIKSSADINAKDRNLYTPLHVAAASGKICQSIGVYSPDSTTNSTVQESVATVLLSSGAEVDSQNAYGNTPAHIACLNGHVSVLQELEAYGANLEAVNFRGQTPLHIAAASTHGVECLMFLLSKGVDINKQSLDGRTPLHMTAIHGRFTRSKTLIDKGALLDCADKNGSTPLHIAAQYGHDLLANTLLSYGADPSKRGHEGRTPMHMCCLSGYVECARKFVQAGVNLDAQDDSGKTPLHCAAYKGSIECLELLFCHGANILLLDKLNRLPLHYAVSRGHHPCVLTLIAINSPVNSRDINGCTPLHLAAGYDLDGKCVGYLINHRADLGVTDNRGYMELHYGVAGGNTLGVRMLVEAVGEAGLDSRLLEKVDVTPLHLAAKLGNIDILRTLLSYYRDFNIPADQGITPLMLAAREGHTQCVHFLLRFGAKVVTRDKYTDMTAVHYSAKNGHAQCLALLLHNTEDPGVVNHLDKQHRTALMLAVSGNHIECVQTLLNCNADPNIVDTDEHSCLFRAVVNGQNSVVELLLSSNAKVQTTDVNGKTVLHLAAACGHMTCLKLIMGYMSPREAQAVDKQDCTVLHWACYNGHTDCVEYLIEFFDKMEGNSFSPVHCATFSGSEKCLKLLISKFGREIVEKGDCRKRTPLHIAAIHGHSECASLLLENGAKVDEVDEDGRTPFLAAAQYGQTNVVELLLATKMNRKITDKDDNTALHWACLKKHPQTALVILEDEESQTTIHATNKDNKMPLHISARNGLVEVTRELLKKKASVIAVDNEGLTPALCCAPTTNVAQCLALILQTFPDFVTKTSQENDLFFLASFYETLSKPLKKAQFSFKQSQTEISTLSNEDFHVLNNLTETQIKNEKIENELFINKPEDVKDRNLSLHNTNSETSISQKKKPTTSAEKNKKIFKELSNRKRHCYQCHLSQQRCPDCTLRYIVRQYLSARITKKEFLEYISKNMIYASAEYREKLTKALDVFKPRVLFQGNSLYLDVSNIIEKCGSKLFFDHSKNSKNVTGISSFNLKSFFGTKNKSQVSFETKSHLGRKHEPNISTKTVPDEKKCSKTAEDLKKDLIAVTKRVGNEPADKKRMNIVPNDTIKYLNAANVSDSPDIKVFNDTLWDEVDFLEETNFSSNFDAKSKEIEEKIKESDSKTIKTTESIDSFNNEMVLYEEKSNREVQFLQYLRSFKLGKNKNLDMEYFKALSTYMNKILQKIDAYFTKAPEINFKNEDTVEYYLKAFETDEDDLVKVDLDLETDSTEPETDLSKPETDLSKPETDLSEPETDLSDSEADQTKLECDINKETEENQLQIEDYVEALNKPNQKKKLSQFGINDTENFQQIFECQKQTFKEPVRKCEEKFRKRFESSEDLEEMKKCLTKLKKKMENLAKNNEDKEKIIEEKIAQECNFEENVEEDSDFLEKKKLKNKESCSIS